MDNKDKSSLKKGIPVYLVFIFLISVLGFVIYSQNTKPQQQEVHINNQINTKYDENNNSDEAKETEITDTGSSAVNKTENKLSSIKTLSEIIENRRTWDAIEKQLYGQKAPDFTVKSLDGKDIRLSDFVEDKEVIVVFWATWCGFCVKEIPHLNKLTEKMSDQAKVLAISDEPPSTVKRFASNREINYRLATADRGYSNMGNFYVNITRLGRPTAMHVDKNGNIKIIYIGAPSYDELESLVKAVK